MKPQVIIICFQQFFCLISIALALLISLPSSSVAQIIDSKPYLNTKLLQNRVNNLIQIEGIDTIDLSNFIIDLEAGDNDFSNQFYQELKNKFSRGDRPVDLDLSNSIIKGNFDINKIGFTTPLAEGAFSSLLTPTEREKIKNLDLFVNPIKIGIPNINVFRGGLQLQGTFFTGNVDFSQTWFLKKITACNSNFQQKFDTNNSLFADDVSFGNSIFNQDINLSRTNFLAIVKFNESQFQGIINLQKSYFAETVNFNNANFFQLTDFTRNVFGKTVDFGQTIWRDRVIFSKSKFLSSLVFTGTTFEKTVAFRDVYFNSLVNFNNVNLLNRIDFTNAFFSPQARINASGLAFDAEAAKIIGDSGTIGQVIKVDTFEENQTILRNLIRNFRSLEQISDANQIEYQREKLHLQQLGNLITTTPWQKILSLTWMSQILSWLSLSLLLLLGNYGTNVNLVFSVGVIAIAFFSLIFWLIDRYRPKISQPILPSRYEIICMFGSYILLTLFSIFNIFITTNKPWLTLACIAIILLPIPLILIIRIYWQGRYHQLLDVSYFVENGDARQFRLMFGRMPIIPRFAFYRDRYEPILWDKGWAWLNYYDFSLNNLFKLGFNDIRLRDRYLPGIVAALVWYQWILGGLYIILLLWTLSRTIPGLNLLIYF